MPIMLTNHVIIHDVQPTNTPASLLPIHPGHRVQIRAYAAGVLLKYVDVDTCVVHRDDGEIERVDLSDICLAPPALPKRQNERQQRK